MALKKLISCIFLTILGIEFTHQLELYSDLPTYDEIKYLWSGVNQQIYFGFDWPVYPLHYFLLSLFIPDPLQLYYFNQQLLVILLPISFFLLLSTYIKHRYALLLSVLILYMDSNLLAFTKVNHLSTVILLLGGILLLLPNKSLLFRLVAITLIFTLASFTRAEYYLPFLLTLTILLGYAVFQWVSFRHLKALAIALPLTIISMVMVWGIGQPLQGGRSTYAFKQMYSINYVERHNLGIEIPDHEAIVLEVFGPINSISDAWKSNRIEVINNLQYNVEHMINNLIWKTVDMSIPRRIYHESRPPDFDFFMERLALFGCLLLFTLLLLKRRKHKTQSLNNIWYFYSLIIVGIGLGISIFYYPDDRYLTTVALFVYANLLFFLTRYFQFRYRVLSFLLPLLAIVAIFINRPHANLYFADTMIYQKVYSEYEKLNLTETDTLLVTYDFWGFNHRSAQTLLIEDDMDDSNITPGIKAILAKESTFSNITNDLGQFHKIAIDDTLNLYVPLRNID